MPINWTVLLTTLLLGAVAGAQPRGGALTPPPGVTVERDIVYGKVGSRNLLLDLYRPARRTGPVPVVVWIHGGAFRMGSKSSREGEGAIELTTHGYAVASVNYRLSGEAIFPAQIQDCKAAVRWLRANAARYGLDAGHIGAWGASAGAHLAAMLGTSAGVAELEGSAGNPDQSSAVDAVVNFFGPTDFLRMDEAAIPGGQKHNPAGSPESQLVGGAIQDNRDKVAKANPITYVRKPPPFLMLHGERDPLVPWNQSQLLFEALSKAGGQVTFHRIAGAGHGGPQFETRPVRAMVLAFFDQYLVGFVK